MTPLASSSTSSKNHELIISNISKNDKEDKYVHKVTDNSVDFFTKKVVRGDAPKSKILATFSDMKQKKEITINWSKVNVDDASATPESLEKFIKIPKIEIKEHSQILRLTQNAGSGPPTVTEIRIPSAADLRSEGVEEKDIQFGVGPIELKLGADNQWLLKFSHKQSKYNVDEAVRLDGDQNPTSLIDSKNVKKAFLKLNTVGLLIDQVPNLLDERGYLDINKLAVHKAEDAPEVLSSVQLSDSSADAENGAGRTDDGSSLSDHARSLDQSKLFTQVAISPDSSPSSLKKPLLQPVNPVMEELKTKIAERNRQKELKAILPDLSPSSPKKPLLQPVNPVMEELKTKIAERNRQKELKAILPDSSPSSPKKPLLQPVNPVMEELNTKPADIDTQTITDKYGASIKNVEKVLVEIADLIKNRFENEREISSKVYVIRTEIDNPENYNADKWSEDEIKNWLSEHQKTADDILLHLKAKLRLFNS